MGFTSFTRQFIRLEKERDAKFLLRSRRALAEWNDDDVAEEAKAANASPSPPSHLLM